MYWKLKKNCQKIERDIYVCTHTLQYMMRDCRWKQYAPTTSEEPFVVRDGYYDPLARLYHYQLKKKRTKRIFFQEHIIDRNSVNLIEYKVSTFVIDTILYNYTWMKNRCSDIIFIFMLNWTFMESCFFFCIILWTILQGSH